MVETALRFTGYTYPLEKQLAAFQLLQRVYQNGDGGREAALGLARSALFLSGLLDEGDRRYGVVRKGYEAAGTAGADQETPLSWYCRGALLGLLLREKGAAAAVELSKYEAALEKAMEKPGIDRGGPLRALGMFYLRAPPWPTGPGDFDLALEYLNRAAKEYPSHPQNHLFYAYALHEDGRDREARDQLEAAGSVLSEGEWGDYLGVWEKEMAAFRTEAGF